MTPQTQIQTHLVDKSIFSRIRSNLKNSHEFKKQYFDTIVNIVLFLIFIVIVGIFLYFRYQGKKNVEEQKKKENDKRMYIFSKLKQFENRREKINNEMITNLPHY